MQIIKELQRRNVFRMAVGYVVSCWLLAQVADLVFENIGTPDWVMQTLMLLMALGFPVVLFFSWAYEVTPEGIKRESEVDRSRSMTQVTGRKLDRAIMLVLLVAIAVLLFDKFVLDPRRDAELVEAMTQAGTEEAVAGPSADAVTDGERSGPPMLAVLPFTSSSLGGDSEFFATGVHDDLLTQLAQLQSIRVISRTSVLEYGDTERNIREIGRALGADTILEGGVQSAGNRIRINAQLIDARTDEHLWAQTYDRELSPANIFEVQTEIARAISSAMHATLTDQEDALLTRMPTENMAAYRAYHRAMDIRDSSNVFDAKSFRLALEEAVALDPEFTQAWAELAGVLSFENFSVVKPGLLREAEQALEKIRMIAPQSADYLMAQSFYTYYVLKDYVRAHQLITQALEMRPSDARILQLKSWIERRLGDHEGRLESLRQAQMLDPRNPIWSRNIAGELTIAHRYAEAAAEIEAFGLEDYHLAHLSSVLQLREHHDLGRWAESVKTIHREFAADSDDYNLWEALIANREFEAAARLAEGMAGQWMKGTVTTGALPDRQLTQVVTFWFLQSGERLAEVLSEARNFLDQVDIADGEFTHPNVLLDLALLTAAEGDAEETERLIRRWERTVSMDLAEMTNKWHRVCRVLGMSGSTAVVTECIRRGLGQPSQVMPFMEPFLPYYDSIRDEPEFQALLSEIELASTDP